MLISVACLFKHSHFLFVQDLETKMGGQMPRMLCLDDYFMTEVERMQTDEETGKRLLLKVSRRSTGKKNNFKFETFF